MKSQGLEPLKACQKIICNKIDSTNVLITTGNSVLQGEIGDHAKFSKNASLLGSLPEVPDLKDVPFLTFCYEPTAISEARDILSNFGYVYQIAPIQVNINICLCFFQKCLIAKVLFFKTFGNWL